MSVLEHKQALTLDQLAVELQRQQETKRDYVADTRRVGFYCNEQGQHEITLDAVDEEIFGVLPKAHEQIGSRLKIPKAYYDRMLSSAPQLLAMNVSHWFLNSHEKRMFRTLDGKVRAVLSDRYRRLDNWDLAQHLLPEFRTVPGLEFLVSALTPERMFIRATLPQLRAEIKVGDTVQAGVEISNSEVGSGALSVRPYILRLSCMNGMTSTVALRKYHTGRRVQETEDALGIFSDETRRADDKVVFMKAADLVRASLTDIRFHEIVEQLKQASETNPVASPPAAVQLLGNNIGLDEDERNSVLQFLSTGGDLSQWGMINAITETAKAAESFDRLVEIEEKAGQLADYATEQWNQIAVAV